MTITRSVRSLAAAALAAGLVLPVAASAAGGPGKHGGPGGGGHASSRSGHQGHKVDGVLQTMGTTVPATLTVQTASSATITVTVSATTKLVRGHGGRSNLGEFTSGDRVTAWGSFVTGSTTTFNARQIKDVSIAYSHVVGSVAGPWSSGVTLLPAGRGSPHSPYRRNEVIDVTLSPTTKVISGSVTLTASAVTWSQTPPLHVQVAGLYDSTNHMLLADRVHILGTPGRQHPSAKPTP